MSQSYQEVEDARRVAFFTGDSPPTEECSADEIRIVPDKWLERRTERYGKDRLAYQDKQRFEQRAFKLPADVFLQWCLYQTTVEPRFDPKHLTLCRWHTPLNSLARRVKGHREFDPEDPKEAWARITRVIEARYGQPWKEWLESQRFVMWHRTHDEAKWVENLCTWRDLVQDFDDSWKKCSHPGPALTRAEIMALARKHPRPMPEGFPGNEANWEFCMFLQYLVLHTGNSVQELGQNGLAPLLGCSPWKARSQIQWAMDEKVGVLVLESKQYKPGKNCRKYRVTEKLNEWTK